MKLVNNFEQVIVCVEGGKIRVTNRIVFKSLIFYWPLNVPSNKNTTEKD